MPPRLVIQFIPMFVMLLVAGAIDLRQRRIPNWLTACIALVGFAQTFTPGRTVSPGQAALGMLVGFALTIVLFVLRAIGGGDVKLMVALGAWLGPVNVLIVYIVKDLIGLAVVLVQAAHQGRLRVLAGNSLAVIVNLVHVRDVGLETVQRTGLSAKSIDKPLPMAVLVHLAVLVLMSLRPGGF